MKSMIFFLTLSCIHLAGAMTETIVNPVRRDYQDEVVRLHTPLDAKETTRLVRTSDGQEISYQPVQNEDGTINAAILVSLPAAAKHGDWPSQTVAFEPGRPAAADPRVLLRREEDTYILDNGIVAVRVPAGAPAGTAPAPVAALRMPDGAWIGKGTLHSELPPVSFSSRVTGDGTVFAEITLDYRFEGRSGPDRETPSFLRTRISLSPGHHHIVIREEHAMTRNCYWEFSLTEGWPARKAQTEIFGGGAGKPTNRAMWPKDFTPLGMTKAALDARYADGDPRLGHTLLWLVPRWNQHYQDGWFFAAEHEGRVAGAIVCHAGDWIWPHANKLDVRAAANGEAAVLRCPLWKGARTWWLVAGPADTVGVTTTEEQREDETRTKRHNHAHTYVRRHAWEALETVRRYVLEWPGINGTFSGEDFYSSGINPSGFWRQQARHAMRNAGKPVHSMEHLTKMQVMFDPDMYGSYWTYWSPQNPNFFTDFIKRPIAMVSNLKAHPEFETFAAQAEQKLREDMLHAITLPGGAGQECPGYQAHALQQYEALAELCRDHLGFDPTQWPRYQAGRDFLWRSSQPRRGGKRLFHPGGDTHPGPHGPKDATPYRSSDPRTWSSEEFPGFGAILRNRCGTDRETYLAFKSGPNRGHYHGDQLSLHYCAAAAPLVVDHFCSYNPRAGQEHMHNRLAFTVEDFDHANMDGYERLIAFKPGPAADIAIGQVESERLRWVPPRPPEDWDREFPQVRFDTPLRYRRTVVLVKGETDYVVLRDQHDGPEVIASFMLHAYGHAPRQNGNHFQFDGFTLFCAAPESFSVKSLPWSHGNGGGESTEGVQLTRQGNTGEFITVLYPGGQTPAMETIPGGVKIGTDEVVFAGGLDTAEGQVVTVRRDGREVHTLAAAEIDLNRSQGKIGLFVPDAGYPFGELPDWLIRQRALPLKQLMP